MNKMTREFYARDSLIVAKELLGKVLVHEADGRRTAVKIVETEAYRGVLDRAAHSYGGRRTPRVEVMYGAAGFSYVFFVYGMHHCFNIVTGEPGDPQAVLIRAAQPMEGFDELARRRFGCSWGELTGRRRKDLTNGPGKLCAAMGIDRSHNGADLCAGGLYVTQGGGESMSLVAAPRVGVDYAGEAKDFPWRFYIAENAYVSVK